jgi:putative ABC transport system permease protein
MIRNYFLLAYRVIARYKSYSFINILGLAVGLTCGIIIYLWILDELNYDKYNENYSSIYRLVQDEKFETGTFKVAATPAPLGPALKETFPEIKEEARYRPIIEKVMVACKDKKFYENNFGYADPELFKIFTFKFLSGSGEHCLDQPNSLLITKSIAAKYFGSGDPIGKSLQIDGGNVYTVTAVIDDLPANSHLRFDILAPFGKLNEMGWNVGWNNNYYYSYMLFDNKYNYRLMKDKFHKFLVNKFKVKDEEITSDFYLQPLSDIHLKSDFDIDLYSHTEFRYQYIYIFLTVGIIILLIVIINYMNLSTARAARRAREVGIRKTVGASRRQLILQYLGESFILTVISCFIALILTELFLPYINDFTGKALGIHYRDHEFSLGLICIILFTSLAAGSYPAFFLSSYSPYLVLKGTVKTGSSLFRKILVIFQFSLSVVLIIGTFVISDQLHFIQKKDLGIKKEQVLYTEFKGDFYKNFRMFKSDLKNLPDVVNVTYSSDIPTYTVHSGWGISWEGSTPNSDFLIHQFMVDEDYIPTFGIQLKEGRNFDLSHPTDSGNFILNEAAVRMMGLKEPVGKWFSPSGTKGTIIGVMKDFNFKSLHKPVEPLFIYLSKDHWGYIIVKIKSGDVTKTMSGITNVWEKYNPDFPMDFKFLDSEYEKLYTSEQKMGILFGLFAMVAIFLSCLGLFGLASYITETKTREIGIRKAMGASGYKIVTMLSADFTYWVLIATLIGLPSAYLYLHHWLQNFAFRTSMHAGTFILASILVLVISQLSVLYQTLKASGKDPADVLKYE